MERRRGNDDEVLKSTVGELAGRFREVILKNGYLGWSRIEVYNRHWADFLLPPTISIRDRDKLALIFWSTITTSRTLRPTFRQAMRLDSVLPSPAADVCLSLTDRDRWRKVSLVYASGRSMDGRQQDKLRRFLPSGFNWPFVLISDKVTGERRLVTSPYGFVPGVAYGADGQLYQFGWCREKVGRSNLSFRHSRNWKNKIIKERK